MPPHIEPAESMVHMPNFALAMLLKPLIMIPLFFVAACGRIAVYRWMKDGKLKRLLLIRWG
jgi:hypothetical protein